MTQFIGRILIIAREPDSVCELCGKMDECRPYGSGGKSICYDCGMKDKAEVERQIVKRIETAFMQPLDN